MENTQIKSLGGITATFSNKSISFGSFMLASFAFQSDNLNPNVLWEACQEK